MTDTRAERMARLTSITAAELAESIMEVGAKSVFGDRKSVLETALARVACELWLAIEIAAQAEAAGVTPDGAGIFIEQGKMDLSILPLGERKPDPKDPGGLFIELKLLAPVENFYDQLGQLRGDHDKLANARVKHAFEATLMFDVFPSSAACRWTRPVRAEVLTLDEAFAKVVNSCPFLTHLRCWGPEPLEHDWYHGTARLDLWRHVLRSVDKDSAG